ncbi:ATP-dependent Clp protease adapter ClpS [Geoalkalibacter halelectricus]|uniref:ATP-dependent Clp protease adapter protein ClpS n=1 Tax=Geoalkalibacter halelectricus TaxID=2847045 RepID=A0ABY5ZJN1_9BACT|nr:ATP-dependent Clp protease adapter ClpS [Geoalkalibacter halelectricus]MDO3379004.1 ATP-dependent Clp protease adapter ClpS [Geoalkalibacter halelectricus]UWZ78818.1 ATP-dependent Clp protease adapter ClpS [Geoalkalibacter halelectricus]
MTRKSTGGQTGVASQVRAKTAQPPLFKVLMHNDDYTTMEFVVTMLETVFHKSPAEANRIMLNIHYRGIGVCGYYPYDIAETKVSKVHERAREAGHPLRCSMEES